MPAPTKNSVIGKKEHLRDSLELTVRNREKGPKLCFGPDLQVMEASKTPSENAFIFLP